MGKYAKNGALHGLNGKIANGDAKAEDESDASELSQTSDLENLDDEDEEEEK